MKIYLPNNSKQNLGGGWTFRRNFIKGGKGLFEVVNNWKDCDIVLITGATMTDRQEMESAKASGKKIIFRIDNMPKDSRNRGTAFSRMRDFGKMADHIIFQSNWAKEYVGDWLLKNGSPAMKHVFKQLNSEKKDVPHDGEMFDCTTVIYNGIDTDAFYPDVSRQGAERYLFVQYNRDENKRFPEAAYHFYKEAKKNDSVRLWCMGNFSPEMIEYKFDFFNNEAVSYIPPTDDPKHMGDIMRQCKYLLFPAYLDASPNTVAEAMACGCEVLLANENGGTIEVINKHKSKPYTIQEMAMDYYNIFKLYE